MPRPTRIALAFAVLVVILAACGSTKQIFQNVGENLATADRPATVDGAPPGDEGAGFAEGKDVGGDDVVLANLVDLTERRIVKTGEITIEVSSVASATGTVRALALELDGYVGASSAGEADQAATLTLRIPADRFDEAIERLHDLDGTVIAEATREEDVTSTIVDLEARIANLEASEAQYRALVERAEKIDDILAVQRRLDDVRGQIEQLKAQLEQLSNLADLSTLTVTLAPQDKPVEATAAGWDPGATFDRAVAALVGFGQGIGTVAIWLGVVGLPILLGLALLALVGLRLLPRVTRGRSTQPPAA